MQVRKYLELSDPQRPAGQGKQSEDGGDDAADANETRPQTR